MKLRETSKLAAFLAILTGPPLWTCTARPLRAAEGPSPIDLADIVGGGDGRGTATGEFVGIDPSTGEFAPDIFRGHIFHNGQPLVDVPESEFVDAVFLLLDMDPGAPGANMQITRSGIMFDFEPEDVNCPGDRCGASWDHIRWNSNPGVDREFLSVGGSRYETGVGVHASAGITFNLDAIRAYHGADSVGYVSAVTGIDECGGNVQLYMILTGPEGILASASTHATSHQGRLLGLNIPPEAKYLTLATGSRGEDYCDHGTFANLLIRPPADLSGSFVRGDVDGDGTIDLTDPVNTLNWLFLGGEEPPCVDAMDADDTGRVNLSDAIYTLNFLFLGGPPPRPPYPDFGLDPTSDGVGCNSMAPSGLPRLDLSERLVEDGSLEVIPHLPAGAVEQAVLSIDGEAVGDGKSLGRLVVNAMNLEDGEHRVALRVPRQDGGEGWVEEAFEVRNPTAVVRSFEAPEVIWPTGEVEIIVETDGDVQHLGADLSSLFGSAPPPVEVERIARNSYRLFFVAPRVNRLEERRHPVPLQVVGADGRGYVFKGIEMFLARAPILPFTSDQGILRFRGVALVDAGGEDSASRIVDMDPDIALESDGEPGFLHVAVEGEIDGAQLLLAAGGYGGHIAVPLVGLDPIGELGDVHIFAIPVRAMGKPGDGKEEEEDEDFDLVAATVDPMGHVSIFDDPTVASRLEAVPKYSVRGKVQHQYTSPDWVTATGKLDGLELRVLDSAGTQVATGVVAWDGRYQVKFSQPTLTNLPYSIELRTEAPDAKVITSGTPSVVHSYKHPTTFSPTAYVPYELDIKVPLSQSGAFHTFRAVRRASAWYRSHGMTLSQTVVVWETDYDPGVSHYDSIADKIHLQGIKADPDQYDDSVILHEIGHRATELLSSDDSPGGYHEREERYSATLAWSEGLATYLGQTILGDRRYVDMRSSGSIDYYIDDMTGVPKGTHDGTESGNLSEGLVAAFLWDLHDPVSSPENDYLTGLQSLTLESFKAMKNTSQLGRGISGKADLADFVKLSGCALSSTMKSHMHTLLSKRFAIDWLNSSGFCN